MLLLPLQVAPHVPAGHGVSPWLLALLPFLVAGLWFLLRLSVRAKIETFQTKQTALEVALADEKRVRETVVADQKALEQRVATSLATALAGFAAELKADRERFERGLTSQIAELKGAVEHLTERLEDEFRDRDRACEERHHRLGERHDSTRTEIDDLRAKVADLEGTAVPRSEWARDKVTLLAQGETIMNYLKDLVGRKS